MALYRGQLPGSCTKATLRIWWHSVHTHPNFRSAHVEPRRPLVHVMTLRPSAPSWRRQPRVGSLSLSSGPYFWATAADQD